MRFSSLRRNVPEGYKPQSSLKAHSKIRLQGVSEVARTKKRIQALLRDIVTIRDGGCILRDIRHCGGIPGEPGVVIQADHLIERSNSATYADSRLVVCVCKGCHGWKHFKKSNHDLYNRLVRSILPPDRVALWDACEAEQYRPKRTTSYDWKLAELALEAELREVIKR